MGKLGTAYLVAYNIAQLVGWTFILYLFIPHFTHLLGTGVPSNGLYQELSITLRLFQVAAYLEVVHNIVGIVKSNPIVTGMQVTSRVFLVMGICENFKAVHTSIQLSTMILAWSITEIIRYSYYTASLLNMKIGLLTWLRYTLFIVLYPLGAGSELLCIYKAFPEIKSSRIYDISMPNKLNVTFTFYYLVILIVLSYVPGFPQLYCYMFTQRRKILGRIADEKKRD